MGIPNARLPNLVYDVYTIKFSVIILKLLTSEKEVRTSLVTPELGCIQGADAAQTHHFDALDLNLFLQAATVIG